MSEPIKVGDLVMVVRWGGCKCNGRIGLVYQVAHVGSWDLGGTCGNCGTESVIPPGVKFQYANSSSGRPNVPLQWLKRIPPLSELGDVKNDEEITA